MKQHDRTIVFLAHAAERALREVMRLQRELRTLDQQNQELTEQAKEYEAEIRRKDQERITEGMVAEETGGEK